MGPKFKYLRRAAGLLDRKWVPLYKVVPETIKDWRAEGMVLADKLASGAHPNEIGYIDKAKLFEELFVRPCKFYFPLLDNFKRSLATQPELKLSQLALKITRICDNHSCPRPKEAPQAGRQINARKPIQRRPPS